MEQSQRSSLAREVSENTTNELLADQCYEAEGIGLGGRAARKTGGGDYELAPVRDLDWPTDNCG
ncbi:MAG TPA: hypothetical protein VKB53_12555 [Gammaproteobacteria bacterium]|nr:hypothetical protein [Gammaproteobacteria bacterium]